MMQVKMEIIITVPEPKEKDMSYTLSRRQDDVREFVESTLQGVDRIPHSTAKIEWKY